MQREQIIEATKEKGIKIRKEDFIEEKRSGTDPERPKFNSMIKKLRSGEYEGVVAYSLDRLSRNLEDSGKIFNLVIRDRKTKLLIAQEGFRDVDWTSYVGASIFLAHAIGSIFQAVNTQVKTKDAAEFLRHQGRQIGKLPYGYRKTWMDRKNKIYEIEINESEAEKVIEIFRLAMKGWGRRRIATEMGLTDATVRHILQNEKYTGYTIVDGKVVEMEMPAIIPLSLFCRINHGHELCRARGKIPSA